MSVAVLIAYLDQPSRQRPYELVRDFWRESFPAFHVVDVWANSPPLNKARSLNEAAWRAIRVFGHETLICADADSLVSPRQVELALARCQDGPVSAFRQYRRITRAQTEALTHWSQAFACEPDWVLSDSGSTGCAVIRAEHWLQLGGMDEGFPLPLYEDLAFWTAAAARWPLRRVEGPLVHLWHERDEGRWPQLEQACRARYERYKLAAGDVEALQKIQAS